MTEGMDWVDWALLMATVLSPILSIVTWYASMRLAARPSSSSHLSRRDKEDREKSSATLDLRLASADIAQAVARYGRVPIERPLQTSFLGAIRRLMREMECGPSSPKPAFAVRSCERTPPTAHGDGRFPPLAGQMDKAGVGGFRLSVKLHEGEHREHFVKSVNASGGGVRRTVAVCSPDQLSWLGNRVRCYLVYATPEPVNPVGEDAPDVCLKSADPLGTPHGHDWEPKVKDVPSDAIWLIDASGASAPRVTVSESSGWRERYLPTLFVTALAILFIVSLVFLIERMVATAYELVGGDWLLAPGTVTLYVAVAAAVLFLISVLRVTYVRAKAYMRHERHWRGQWTADTMTCLRDAAEMRNGLADPDALRR